MEKFKLADVLSRELKGKNISQIAKDIGISGALLFDWYKARRAPSAKNFPALLKLAHHLGLSLEELIFDRSNGEKITLASTTFNDGGSQYRVQIEKMKK